VYATRHVRVHVQIFAIYHTLKPNYPYRWPTPSSTPVVECRQFEDALPQGYFHRLPLEILLDVVADGPMSTVVNLSTTCRFIYNFFMDSGVLNAILRAAVLSHMGSLRLVVVS